MRTPVSAYQGVGPNRRLIAQAFTEAKSGLKPGAAVTFGAGAAAGAAGTAAVATTGTTAASEMLDATVKADAQRTAKKIAEKIVEAYKKRGWL